jgi:HEPN domain-containing protein
MSGDQDVRAWTDYAEEGYQAARLLLRRKRPFARVAGFHAQQCAEKYLKALLVAKGADFPKTHDLLRLSELCTESDILVQVDANLLDVLTDFAVGIRYPGDEPTIEEVRQGLGTAATVRRFARRHLGLK